MTDKVSSAPTANKEQFGGDHYKGLKIEVWDYVTANNIPYMEGQIIRYATRWRDKGGMQDLFKLRHYAEKLIEIEMAKPRELRGKDSADVSKPCSNQGKAQPGTDGGNICAGAGTIKQSSLDGDVGVSAYGAGAAINSAIKPNMTQDYVDAVMLGLMGFGKMRPPMAVFSKEVLAAKRNQLHKNLDMATKKSHQVVDELDDETVNFLDNSTVLWPAM